MTQNGKEPGGNDPQIGGIAQFLCEPNPKPSLGEIECKDQISPSAPEDSAHIGRSKVTTPLFPNIHPL
jgi:hypothetical protein